MMLKSVGGLLFLSSVALGARDYTQLNKVLDTITYSIPTDGIDVPVVSLKDDIVCNEFAIKSLGMGTAAGATDQSIQIETRIDEFQIKCLVNVCYGFFGCSVATLSALVESNALDIFLRQQVESTNFQEAGPNKATTLGTCEDTVNVEPLSATFPLSLAIGSIKNELRKPLCDAVRGQLATELNALFIDNVLLQMPVNEDYLSRTKMIERATAQDQSPNPPNTELIPFAEFLGELLNELDEIVQFLRAIVDGTLTQVPVWIDLGSLTVEQFLEQLKNPDTKIIDLLGYIDFNALFGEETEIAKWLASVNFESLIGDLSFADLIAKLEAILQDLKPNAKPTANGPSFLGPDSFIWDLLGIEYNPNEEPIFTLINGLFDVNIQYGEIVRDGKTYHEITNIHEAIIKLFGEDALSFPIADQVTVDFMLKKVMLNADIDLPGIPETLGKNTVLLPPISFDSVGIIIEFNAKGDIEIPNPLEPDAVLDFQFDEDVELDLEWNGFFFQTAFIAGLNPAIIKTMDPKDTTRTFKCLLEALYFKITAAVMESTSIGFGVKLLKQNPDAVFAFVADVGNTIFPMYQAILPKIAGTGFVDNLQVVEVLPKEVCSIPPGIIDTQNPTTTPTGNPTTTPTGNPTTSQINDDKTPNPTTSPTNDEDKTPNPTTSPTNDEDKTPNPTTSPTNDEDKTPNPTTSPTNDEDKTPNPTTSPINDEDKTQNPTASPTKNPTRAPTVIQGEPGADTGNSVGGEDPAEKKNNDEPSNMGMIIGASAGGVVVLGAIAALVMLKQKRSKQADLPMSTSYLSPDNIPDRKSSGNPMFGQEP